MAQLNDMEELLEQITDPEIKDYMREAMSCYYANAYRGCVVLCVIAMFEDLMRKLQELSYINGRARGVYNLLEAKRQDQDVFENEMLEQLCSNKIISKLEKDIFNNLKTLRHKSAHPSGHKPTSEEARYIFSEVIIKVLTQPLLKTVHLIEEIMYRVNNENYFPTITAEIIKSIVQNELTNLNEDAYPLIIRKLTDEIKDSQITEKTNQKLFIYGLALVNDDDVSKKIYNIFIKDNLHNLQLRGIIIPLFTKENKMMSYIKDDAITIERLNSVIINRIDNEEGVGNVPNNSSNFFTENAELIKEFELYNKFKTSIEKIFEKYEYSFPKELLTFDDFRTLTIAKYKANARSSRFTTSNEFVEKFEYIDSFLALEPIDAFELCLNIQTAANGRSFSSRSYYNNHFNDFPNLKSKAKEYLESLQDLTYIDSDLILKINEDSTPTTDTDNNTEGEG